MIDHQSLKEFTKTKYYEYLYNNHQLIYDEGDQFNIEVGELISKETSQLAIILKCHLIIEHYIDDLLKVAYPLVKWEAMNLTFAKKLELINTPGVAVAIMFYKAIKSLNSIRNKFAHQLTYMLKESDLNEIRKSMDMWEKLKGHKSVKGIKLVEEFTVWVCANINNLTNGIRRHSPQTGLPGYMIWLNDMNQPLDT